MNNYFYILIVILSFMIDYSILVPFIYLKILKDHVLLEEIKLNFLFYIKYSQIISRQEFSHAYKLSYISRDYNFESFSRLKNENHILLFNSFSFFSTKKAYNISNIIIFPEKYIPVLNKEMLLFFDCKQFIFFIEQKIFDNLVKYDFINDEKIYVKIFIPEEISKNLVDNSKNLTIPECYFVPMFLSFILFFFYLFYYNFLVPLLYKDFWLFFISQFYLFVPLRFILLILLSIKLIIIQNIRGLIPSAPGFFVILSVQKSLIKTNIITMILLSNEGLYIFENMKRIIKKMTIYKLQFFFLTIFLTLILSFPFHFIMVILDAILFIIIIIHAFINYRKLKKTQKIAFITNKRYIPFINLKISIWIKQNILLCIYSITSFIIHFYSKFSTNEILIDEIVCLKSDMLQYCVENLFLFTFCYLYRPRDLERNFFIVYTEKFGAINLKFYYTELDKENNIKYIMSNKVKKESYLNKKNISNIRKENINKPIIILNPRLILRAKENINKRNENEHKKFYFNDKFSMSIGNIK